MKKRSSVKEISLFAIGELIISALTVAVFLILDLAGVYSFSAKVIFGALLGCAVIVANYAMLSLSVNNAINRFIEMRGDREMSEEEAEQFAAKNSAPIQNAIKTSFITRTVSMMATLVLAFITGWFNPLATAIPMFAFRPLLTVLELIQSKDRKKPDPSKFVKYDFEDEDKNKEEEESD